MYEVVGCRSCGALWIREGEADTATCSRCRTRYQVDRLRTLGEADSIEAAREIRSRLIADRADYGGIVAGYGELDGDGNDGVVSDESYLQAHGIDPQTVSEAGEPPKVVRRAGWDVVLDAIGEVENATPDGILPVAKASGLSETDVTEILERLHQDGRVTRDGDEYRRI